jgi:hypothetical protein
MLTNNTAENGTPRAVSRATWEASRRPMPATEIGIRCTSAASGITAKQAARPISAPSARAEEERQHREQLLHDRQQKERRESTALRPVDGERRVDRTDPQPVREPEYGRVAEEALPWLPEQDQGRAEDRQPERHRSHGLDAAARNGGRQELQVNDDRTDRDDQAGEEAQAAFHEYGGGGVGAVDALVPHLDEAHDVRADAAERHDQTEEGTDVVEADRGAETRSDRGGVEQELPLPRHQHPVDEHHRHGGKQQIRDSARQHVVRFVEVQLGKQDPDHDRTEADLQQAPRAHGSLHLSRRRAAPGGGPC